MLLTELIALGCDSKLAAEGSTKGGGAGVNHSTGNGGNRVLLRQQLTGFFKTLLGQVAKDGSVKNLTEASLEFAIVQPDLTSQMDDRRRILQVIPQDLLGMVEAIALIPIHPHRNQGHFLKRLNEKGDQLQRLGFQVQFLG